MNTKQDYQKPQVEVIELQLEAPVAGSADSLNYNGNSGRSNEEEVNNFWGKNNFID